MILGRQESNLNLIWVKFDLGKIWWTQSLCSANFDIRNVIYLPEANLKAIDDINIVRSGTIAEMLWLNMNKSYDHQMWAE